MASLATSRARHERLAYRTTFEEAMGKWATRKGSWSTPASTARRSGGRPRDVPQRKAFFDYTTDTRQQWLRAELPLVQTDISLANEANYSAATAMRLP